MRSSLALRHALVLTLIQWELVPEVAILLILSRTIGFLYYGGV